MIEFGPREFFISSIIILIPLLSIVAGLLTLKKTHLILRIPVIICAIFFSGLALIVRPVSYDYEILYYVSSSLAWIFIILVGIRKATKKNLFIRPVYLGITSAAFVLFCLWVIDLIFPLIFFYIRWPVLIFYGLVLVSSSLYGYLILFKTKIENGYALELKYFSSIIATLILAYLFPVIYKMTVHSNYLKCSDSLTSTLLYSLFLFALWAAGLAFWFNRNRRINSI